VTSQGGSTVSPRVWWPDVVIDKLARDPKFWRRREQPFGEPAPQQHHITAIPIATRISQNGSRTPEKEEQVVCTETAPKGPIEEEDSAEPYYRKALVLPPHFLTILSS
jgi:hypothetical protein